MNSVQQMFVGPAPVGTASASLTDVDLPKAQTTSGPVQERWLSPGDGFRPIWSAPPGTGGPTANPPFGDGQPAFEGPGAGPDQGGFLGLINTLINQLGGLIKQYTGETNAEGPPTQTVADATFASTGDPHLSETGTLQNSAGATGSVNRHFDSMSGHDNLVSSQDFNGGFRLSTTVTTPTSAGVTLNAGATVHLNSDSDTVTMRNDGTYSIATDGKAVTLEPGQSATLDGGAVVTRNTDGSLTVAEENLYGGSVSATLAAKGGGVDATAEFRNASVGGDIARNVANPDAGPQVPPLVRLGEIT